MDAEKRPSGTKIEEKKDVTKMNAARKSSLNVTKKQLLLNVSKIHSKWKRVKQKETPKKNTNKKKKWEQIAGIDSLQIHNKMTQDRNG